MLIQNKYLIIELDDENGSIRSLFDKARNIEFIDSPQLGTLYRLVVPNNKMWLGQYAENTKAKCEITAKGEYAQLRFLKQVTDEGVELDIVVTVKIELAKDSDEAKFSIKIENNTEFVVDEVWFPKIGGLKVDRCADKDIAYFGYAAPFAIRNCKGKAGYNLLYSTTKVNIWSGIPLFHIERKNIGGISLNHYATIPQQSFGVVQCQKFNATELTSAFAYVLHPFVEPGTAFCSEEFGLSLNDGKLQRTLDRYKSFLNTQQSPLSPPKELAETVAMYNIQLRDFEGRYWRAIDSLIPIAEKLLSLGIRDVCVWDMMFENYLKSNNKSFLEDDQPSRVEVLSNVIKKMVDMGMNVNTLVNFRLANECLNDYDEIVKNMDIKSQFGVKSLESYCIRSSTATYFNGIYEQQGHPLCQNYDKFQNFAVELGKKIVSTFGFNSLFIDQPFGQHYCFDKSHGHKFGADDEFGAIEWVSKLQEQLHRSKAYKYSLGEVPDIFNTRYIEMWWHWPLNALNTSVLRYVLPSSLQTWVIDTKEHCHEISKAFSMGFILSLNTDALNGTIDETPEVAKRIHALKILKDKVQKEIAFDKFIGNFGLEIVSDIAVEANAYRTDKSFAIILGSSEETPKFGKGTVAFDSFGRDVAEAVIYFENGSEQSLALKAENNKFNYQFDCKPEEIQILVIKL